MAEKDKDILSNIELDVGSFIIDVLENFEAIDRPINTSHTHLYYKNIKFSKAESHYDYMFNSDGTVTILNYKGNERNVFIPEKINGKYVTKIGDFAFEAKSLVNIIIPESVTHIGFAAFDFNRLTNIHTEISSIS